jgi:3-oxoacyl-[acyl-carrier protein] reductase
MNLNNKVALVTGGSGDIGSAICIKLAISGASVIVHYNSDQESALKTVDFIKCNGGYAVPIQFDIRNSKSVFDNLSIILKKFSKIDILVNNSGISKSKLFIDITEEEWDEIFDVNVKGIFNCTQFILKNSMLQRKYGKIINISSIWGICGASCESHYSATKAAIIGLTKSLSKEFGPSNINVNVVAPGVIKTKMLDCYSDEDLNALIEETPLNRLGTPEDIANCVAFLASDEASFITGQILSPNGGFII